MVVLAGLVVLVAAAALVATGELAALLVMQEHQAILDKLVAVVVEVAQAVPTIHLTVAVQAILVPLVIPMAQVRELVVQQVMVHLLEMMVRQAMQAQVVLLVMQDRMELVQAMAVLAV